MQSRPIWSYIWIGTCLRYLQDASEGTLVYGNGYILDNIKWFFDGLSENNLYVTLRASDPLREIQKKLEPKTKDSKLTSEEAKELKDTMREIRLTFEAEAKGILSYAVTDKRIDINKLLNNVGLLFKPKVFDSLPEIAKYDFKEAGLCIAFERPTAAAFHILRGTEDVLRVFYKKYIRPARSGLTWGQIINALKNKSRGKKPDPLLISNLDNIRYYQRNPTLHPDIIFDIQEVQDLFNTCIETVNRMASVLIKQEKSQTK